MEVKKIRFSSASVLFYFDAGMKELKKLADPRQAVLVTDTHVFEAHASKFKEWNTIVLEPGEVFKVQATVDSVVEQLLAMGASRQTLLVGIGGGVVTDITGYIASIFMRGIAFGFIPTTILGLVDASIGGKNGIDVGPYKNMMGTIRQPQFILHDLSFLKTLPGDEWSNGFAEIIKHACIRDTSMFRELESVELSHFQRKSAGLKQLIRRNALLKASVVQRDEWEMGQRRLLNFGHTLGHALEKTYDLMHGEAIAVGMSFACALSKELVGFRHSDRVVSLLEKYGLPVTLSFDTKQVMDVLQKDKKAASGQVHFILLEKIGKGSMVSLPFSTIQQKLACWPS